MKSYYRRGSRSSDQLKVSVGIWWSGKKKAKNKFSKICSKICRLAHVYSKSFSERIAGSIVFVLLTLINSQPTWSQLVQWPVAAGGNGHFYEVVPAAGCITWGNASLDAT